MRLWRCTRHLAGIEFLNGREETRRNPEKKSFRLRIESGILVARAGRSDTPMLTWNDLDEANPSATSQIIEAFTRLALASDDIELTEFTDHVTEQAAGRILQSRFGQAGFFKAFIESKNSRCS
jgi:uncharacterized protein YyaL (SSP411 family)